MTAVRQRVVGDGGSAGCVPRSPRATGVVQRPRRDPESAADARELVAAMTLTPSGQSSASVYETARLVTLAPWLTHHAERIGHLLATQGPDGAWGGPQGYALVPTLSATEALLTALRRGDAVRPGEARAAERLVGAVDAGLRFLHARLTAPTGPALPDLPATDLTVPALVGSLNAHLDALRVDPLPGLTPWLGARALPLPAGMDGTRLDRVRALLAAGRPLPEKLLHALEVAGPAAHRAVGVRPVGPGTVGASPAATAAWLGKPDSGVGAAEAVAYLEEVARRHGGPVPCATGITVFERAWALSTMSRAGMALPVPPRLLAGLVATVGPAGTPTAPGLPPDADTTAVTLYALARLGRSVTPESLWGYDTGEHFCTWQGEDGASVTTNAHVLDAFGWHRTYRAPSDARLAEVVRRLTGWLIDRQRPDGRWSDRWHASPYYATSCATLALTGYGPGPGAAQAVARAAGWVLAGQRADGSWGRWGGTVEETAYAVQTLCAAGPAAPAGVRPALGRARRYLATMEGRDGEPALWHDKDLYRPDVIVRAAVCAARHLVRARFGGDVTEEAAIRTTPLISVA
ncbi:prenyltransferase/squalene oxidase repeat-containing protein [Micromonospora sp. RTGN7]|uniref:prenyltransferase/squalene oxidase repeat-containing protein n=1 Tax=Micromonospora sp. RTGN7 TaxID=3016526 RepID=UPI0029FF212E|nr:prenyltransferase/squalene oxidase repeat-containing protein [Micromonospora sp. RTGN7]